jgi:hypothetical protein
VVLELTLYVIGLVLGLFAGYQMGHDRGEESALKAVRRWADHARKED